MLHFNPDARPTLPDARSETEPLRFHRRLPGYRPTPLHRLSALARRLGVGQVLLKDESDRLGLPAFKVLGAAWAAYCQVGRMLDAPPEPWTTLGELREKLAPLLPMELITATEGNHGRAVARVAAWLGFGARVFVPHATAPSRSAAIEDEGARVIRIDGSYDDAVEIAGAARAQRALLLQDTALPGYETIPAWIVDGYSTLGHEIDAELATADEPGPDLVLVQIGVGGLASAAVRHFRRRGVQPPPRIVGVEPDGAACALASLAHGEPTDVTHPVDSVMAGLNAGRISPTAWNWLRRGLDAAISVSDTRAEEAVRELAKAGVASGASGAAGLAGLIELLEGPDATPVRQRLGIDASTRVALICTEGPTDPEAYRRIVGV